MYNTVCALHLPRGPQHDRVRPLVQERLTLRGGLDQGLRAVVHRGPAAQPLLRQVRVRCLLCCVLPLPLVALAPPVSSCCQSAADRLDAGAARATSERTAAARPCRVSHAQTHAYTPKPTPPNHPIPTTPTQTTKPPNGSVFRGYGWNKVTHVTNVHSQGFTFMVHPAAWIVHRQHSRSGADKLYQSQKKDYEKQARSDPKKGDENTSLAGMTHRFRNRVLAQLAEGSYAPAVDRGVRGCVAALPWWRGGGAGEGGGGKVAVYEDDYDRRLRRRRHRRRARRPGAACSPPAGCPAARPAPACRRAPRAPPATLPAASSARATARARPPPPRRRRGRNVWAHPPLLPPPPLQALGSSRRPGCRLRRAARRRRPPPPKCPAGPLGDRRRCRCRRRRHRRVRRRRCHRAAPA